MRKRHMYSSDNVVEEFYKALADKNEGKMRRVHIPRSDVFYVREAIFQDTGIKYSLDRVERAMFLEGMLNARDVFEPERKREWELMVVDFDIDGDGKVTAEEVAMKERMLEIELREEKAESQKKMAWVAMIMMIGFTTYLFTPMMSDSRVSALADLLGLFYIAQTGVVAAYMGATAYMAGKPMGNKVAMSKDMR